MTSRGDEGGAAKLAAAEAQLVLDHFVEGFEWTIPTRFGLRETADDACSERQRRLLVFGVEYPSPRVHTGPGLLERFLKLETARDDAILAYARRWGPLWLCEHDLPYGHNPTCEPYHDDDLQFDMEEELEEGDEDELSEPTLADLRAMSPAERSALESEGVIYWFGEDLSAWRGLSRQMRATLRIARRLQDGNAPEMADWDALPFLSEALSRLVAPRFEDTFNPADRFENDPVLVRELAMHRLPTGPYESGDPDGLGSKDTFAYRVHAVGRLRLAESREFQRRALSQVLNYWLRVGGVRPRHDWSGRKPEIQLGGHGLMGALAVQMLFDCSRTDGLAVCTGCGTPFLPGPRRPRRDRNTYCSDCGTKAAARDAAARYRQTKKYRETYEKWAQRRRPV